MGFAPFACKRGVKIVKQVSPPPGCSRRTAGAALLVFCLACDVRAAERVTVNGLGEPQFADREVSAVFALPQAREKNWRLELSVAQEQGIRVEAALGSDGNSDDILDDSEVSAIVGFDRGAWFITGGDGLENRWIAAPSPAGGPLTLDIRLSGVGAVKTVAFRDGGGALAFAGLPAVPAWLNPVPWNTVRLVARGAGDREEQLVCTVFGDGSTFILK